MAPQFSTGLNLASKKSGPKPGNALGQKRKNTIFDDDSGDEEQGNDGEIEVTTLGGLDEPAPKLSKPSSNAGPPSKRKMQLGTSKPPIKPSTKSSIFDDDEEEEEVKEKAQQEQMHLGLNKSKKPLGHGENFSNLSAIRSSEQHAKEAEELDPSIYSYDAVYDSLHTKPEKSANKTNSEVPKYMENLLRSAEIRKRDQMRARDRQLAKEREAEGDEFADKETFVTSAYRKQQEENRKMEEEEAKRDKEEEERQKKNGGAGMVNFYRDVLSRGEERHQEVVKAAEEAATRIKDGEAPEDTAKDTEEKTEDQKAAELNAQGARVAVNDEGQVVDKRQLLSAGLNVAPKPKAAPAAAPKPTTSRPTGRPGANMGPQGRAGQRARQSEMIASQLEERARQEEEAEAARQKEIAEKTRSSKGSGEKSSAKERFLARKREKEEAAAREKANAK
ncbi:hypothetical protein N7532_003621 [Penicillium argentinense]|uniref:Nuclear speckle splicing regulatory protein 1 N-terminal domain-containing protein n=1 Tax=Penicillium argentinense TaxID=1131581 RepID=A0A9W9FMV7_9EURO|nr:uncharacterized protein N7532_003621 [Penicillium argentinense]KAJ5103092.1 hypothetical protein N7532_003621 [Penicillium argentinense]